MPESTKELSGAELDRAVAERVMGWHQETDYDYKPPQINWVDKNGDFQEIANCEGQLANLPLWKPSESIEAAFQVVEKMRERGFVFQLTDRFATYPRPWWAEFATPDSEYGGQHFASTIPEAVCFAALEAMRQLTEQDAALACIEGSKAE